MTSVSDNDRWNRICDLFEEALPLPASERAALLRRRADDPELVAEVEGLLRGHEHTGGLLDHPPGMPTVEPDPPTPLEDQVREVFAGSYRLVRELGRGGMSHVFLAWEIKHQRRVVLKVLRPEIAQLHGSERFEREVAVVAKLSHPNIVPLIDSGVRDGLAYYVMPFIDGVTLRSHLASMEGGRLEPGEALSYLRDVAAALDFAHVAGVIHRDLKPDNVLLAGPHAYLFDFGIARAGPVGDEEQLTREGAFLGTPGYASPEQVWGGATLDRRADLWAWGVIAWELLTGERPPHPSDPTAALDPPDPVTLREGVPGVSAEVAHLVVRCLEPDPARRPADAAELLEVLGGEPTPRGPIERGGRRRWPAALGMVGAVAAATALLLGRPSAEDVDTLRLPVAVAPFQTESTDSAIRVLGRFAGDWVTQGIQDLEGIEVVPWPAALAAVAADGAADVVGTLARGTGAGTVVAGSLYDLDGRLLFRAEVIDAESGLVRSALEPVSAVPDSAEAALQELVDRIRSSVAIANDPRLAAIPGLARKPPAFEAYRAFDRGVERYLSQDYREASAAFQQAWERDTTFHSSLVYAALTRWNAGEPEPADSLLERVRPHLDRLTTAERTRWEALRAFVDGRASQALRSMMRLAELGPASRAPYNVALLALSMNRPRTALEALEGADPDRGELRGWAQYWTQLAHARHLVGAFDDEADAAAEMRRRHPERRIALVLETRARAAQGRLAEVHRLIELAETMSPDTYWSAGAAGVVAAEALRAHGHESWTATLADAERWLDERLRLDPAHRGHRYWRATAAFDARRWSEARRLFEALVDEAPGNGTYRGTLGLALAHEGDPERAREVLAEGFEWEPGVQTAYRARVAALAGDADAASALLGQAFEERVDGWPWMHEAGFDDFAPVSSDPRVQLLLSPGG